jgi:hypothetical protein
MKYMSPEDIAWLAGLMEGEASIGTWNASGRKSNIPSKHTKYAKVTISSTDKDILERVLDLTNIGSIVLHYGNSKKKKDSHKQSWTWTVGKAEEVIDLLNTVTSYEYFSFHRNEQICETLKVATETVQRKNSGESFSRKRS